MFTPIYFMDCNITTLIEESKSEKDKSAENRISGEKANQSARLYRFHVVFPSVEP